MISNQELVSICSSNCTNGRETKKRINIIKIGRTHFVYFFCRSIYAASAGDPNAEELITNSQHIKTL